MHPALRSFLADKILLTAAQEALVNQCFQPKRSRRNEILVPKGSVPRHVYFVVRGSLRVFLTADDGRESTRFLVFEGHFGTAFPSFILRQPSGAAVQSLEASELLLLSYADRQRLYQEIPGWESMDRQGLELDYIGAIQRVESFITLDAKARYQALLAQMPTITQRCPPALLPTTWASRRKPSAA